MTPEQLRVVDAFVAGPRGGFGGPFGALIRNPELTDALRTVGDCVRFDSSLPAPLREMAIILTARHWTAQFEFYGHQRHALKEGLPPAVAEAIRLGDRPASMEAPESAIYDFVTQLLDTGGVTDGAFQDVESQFGERGATDLIALVGYYCLISFVLNVDRFPMPEGRPKPLAD